MTQSILELLADLVAFPTVSTDSNLALVDYCRDYFAKHGVAARLSRSADGRKANLLASIGPGVDGGIVLAGHTDVVPVVNQQWSTDPFTLVERDGRLYGRGAADMKGFIAVVLSAVPALARARLRVPVHIALTFDEEIGCFGVPLLIEQLREAVPRPSAVIVGEPSEMRVVNAHKGVRIFETTVTGREAHSSAPDKGANAVLAAARLMSFLGGVADELKARGAAGSSAGAGFEPPWTTLNVGPVAGGTAHNIVPNSCGFKWELRLLPDQDPDEVPRRLAQEAVAHVLPVLRATAPGAAVATELTVDVPGLRPKAGSAAERLCLNLTGGNATGAVSFGSEAGMYQAAGLPTVICGPGSIDQAHRPDEHITREQLDTCAAFMRRLVDWADGT